MSGWIPETYDPNDKPYRSSIRGVIKPNVNLKEDNPDWLQGIYYQGDSNSCVGNSTAAAYRYVARKLKGSNQASSALLDDPARLLIYYNARILPELEWNKISATPGVDQQPPAVTDDGCQNRNSFKSLNVYGVCPEDSWRFKVIPDSGQVERVNNLPPVDAYTAAKGSHAVEYCRLDPDHPAEVERDLSLEEKKAVGIVTLMQLKQCLSEGFPVVFGFRYYWEHPNFELQGNRWVLPALDESKQHQGPDWKWDADNNKWVSYGGHSVLAIGYDQSRQQVLCQNSWGDDWGDGGTFWIPYSWITDWEATDDFRMVRLIQK